MDDYLNNTKKPNDHGNEKKNIDDDNRPLALARYWVYSHHIYSNMKRKSIIDEAKVNSLTGFCLAGKPGIICVEGLVDDCEYWWQTVKYY